MSSNREIVEQGLAALSAVSQSEYGLTIEEVLADADREMVAIRVQRLTGILLKQPFADRKKRAPDNDYSATNARFTWHWDQQKLTQADPAATPEIRLLESLRQRGAWHPDDYEFENDRLSWDTFVDDVEHERGLFKVLALYAKDIIEKKQRRRLLEYYRADESARLTAGLDTASLLADHFLTGPAMAVLGIPGLAVGFVLIAADFGLSRIGDPDADRQGDMSR